MLTYTVSIKIQYGCISMEEKQEQLDFTIKTDFLDIKPINLDIEFIKKVIHNEKDKNKETILPQHYLIYGNNGVGKTTISEILRKKDECNYQLNYLDLGKYEGLNFEVYNRHFVAENVHDMNKLNNTGKLINIVIGKNNINKLDKLNAESEKIKDIHSKIKTIDSVIATDKSTFSKNENFLKEELGDNFTELLAKSNDELDLQIKEMTKQLPKQENDIQESLKLLKELVLTKEILELNSNELLNDVPQALTQKREDEIFKFCKYISTKKQWYEIGIESLQNTTHQCPFCHQLINDDTTKKIISDYKISLSNIESKTLQLKIKSAISTISNLQQEYSSTITENNNNHLEHLSNLNNLESESMLKSISALSQLFTKKLENLSIPLNDNHSNITVQVNNYNAVIKKNNILINAYNDEQKRNKTLRDTALENKNKNDALIEKYQKTKLKKSEYTKKHIELQNLLQTIKSNQSQYDSLVAEKDKCKSFFSKLTKEYEESASEEVLKYTDSINNILEKFNFKLEIVATIKVKNDDRSKQTIGDIESQYTVNRKDTKFIINNSQLRYSLSEGEMNAIGLSFFLAQLPNDMSKTVLVFDDPVTSFDTLRIASTSKYILDINSKDTFILTHHTSFANKVFFDCKGNLFCFELEKLIKTQIKASRSFLAKDEIFSHYENIIIAKSKTEINNWKHATRELVELILTNAYLSTINDSSDNLTSAYEKIRFAKKEHGKNVSLVRSFDNKNKANLKKTMQHFLTSYDILSNETHSSNSDKVKMGDEELKAELEKIFTRISNYLSYNLST